MNKFNDLVEESGLLTEDGNKLLEPLLKTLDNILYNPAMRELSDTDLKIFESILHSKINEAISKKTLHKKNNSFATMTDDQFHIYLKNKYGKNYMCKTLTEDELDRCPVPSKEEIMNIIEGGREARRQAEKATPRYFPNKNIYYK